RLPDGNSAVFDGSAIVSFPLHETEVGEFGNAVLHTIGTDSYRRHSNGVTADGLHTIEVTSFSPFALIRLDGPDVSLPDNPDKPDVPLPDNPDEPDVSLPDNPDKSDVLHPDNPVGPDVSLPDNPDGQKSPNTGDTGNVLTWWIVLACALLSMLSAFVWRKFSCPLSLRGSVSDRSNPL
ncbi:MAG: hypothetical protein LBN34_00020, partial [Clostridiales Family XIII bacterium]|nr:hypothetical protein [Clostridiales Family XIII bacterium]